MKNNSIKLVGSCILTSVVLGFVCFLSNSRSSMILSENIEALSTDYEWIIASDGTYRAEEMGTEPSPDFVAAHPNYNYSYGIPVDTYSYKDKDFYNLGTQNWESLHKCYIPSGELIPRSIPNGIYCYCHYGPNGNRMAD